MNLEIYDKKLKMGGKKQINSMNADLNNIKT